MAEQRLHIRKRNHGEVVGHGRAPTMAGRSEQIALRRWSFGLHAAVR